MKQVAIFLADGFEEIEALGTIDILRRAEIQVVSVSITDSKTVTGAHRVSVLADKTFSEVDFSEIDALILPGGMPGAKNLNEHAGIRKTLVEFAAQNKDVAAICAAPMVLANAGLLESKKATCYPGFEKELKNAVHTGEKVTVDGKIITGKGPGAVFDFALQLVEVYRGKSVRDEVAKGLLL